MKTLLLLLSLPALLFPQKDLDRDAVWQLTFADEFNGADLDLSRWVPHDPLGRARDRELQSYTPESTSVSSGQLHIVARRDERTGKYVSGVVTTVGTFSQTRGRFEIRCRVPAGRGLRPGFGLLPVLSGRLPEIAVFDTIGSSPSKVFFGNRWGTEETERSFADSFSVPDLSTGFHTIALEWDREKLAWFVDGKQKFQSVDGVPSQPLYMFLDLAVGGKLSRDPDASTPLPASFDIDYIRVYQRRGVSDQ